jgi:hypothetical protein
MSVITTLDTLISQRINDPNHDENAAVSVAGSDILTWINRVCDDAAKITDCLQTSGAIVGTGAESYALPTPSAQGYRLQVLVVGFASKTVTVTVAGGGGTITAAGASVVAIAEDVATKLDALVGVGAYSDGAYVYLFGINGLTISSVTTNDTAKLTIDNGSSVLWHILTVTDQTTGIIYRPVIDRQEYQGYRVNIIGNSVTGLYLYNLFGYSTARKIYILPLIAASNTLTIEYSQTHPTIVYASGIETPSGLLNNYDQLIVEGVASLYYQTIGDEANEREAFARYMQWLQMLGNEVGLTKPITAELSGLYRFIGKTMKELSNANSR